MYYHDWVTVLHFLEDTHNMEGQVSKKDETDTCLLLYLSVFM